MQLQRLGGYELVEQRGHGAIGRRFVGRSATGEVIVECADVLETLPAAERDPVREYFLRAADAAQALEHPGIVRLLDVQQEGAVLYLVTEQVCGERLDRVAAGGGLSHAALLEMVAGAAEALCAAHRHGVVHGHVSPACLIRVEERAVRVAGFGSAMPGRDPLSGTADAERTSYMPPEQVRGRALDGRSDLFSLAVVLFELRFGVRPFPGDSVSSIVYRIVHEPPVDVADCPEALGRFFERALAKRPEERFPDGSSFAAELRRAALLTSRHATRRLDPVSEARPVAAVPRSVSRGAPAKAVAAGLAVALVLAAAWWLARGRAGRSPAVPPVAFSEAQVRTDPPGLPVRLDGLPLEDGRVRFRTAGPYGVLSVEQGCRRVERPLGPEDAGTEIVLVADTVQLEWSVDAGVDGASVSLNGRRVGTAPASVTLDLCRDNRLELAANGYRPAAVRIPSGATPLDARKALFALSMEPIPRGWLEVPELRGLELEYSVNGRALSRGERTIELEQGKHELRLRNDYHWIDRTYSVDVPVGKRVVPEIARIELGTLRVQAFPANCVVELRSAGGAWRHLDETPVERRLAAGRYEVKVTLKPTGQSQVRSVNLKPGENPPVRVSFGRAG